MISIIEFAEDYASKSTLPQKHCCVIATTQGRILSKGINTPGGSGSTHTFHAEYNAFRRMREDQLKGCQQQI